MLRSLCAELPGHTLHVIQRGRLKAACFLRDEDCEAYLGYLRDSAASRCAVHAYALMGNHVHLLLTPARVRGATDLLRASRERYASYAEASHCRVGALWEDRFEAFPVYVRRYLLACMRYIELNPVRARLVPSPEHYRWSSYHANALGRNDALITPHAHYCALGRSAKLRQAVYAAYVQAAAPAMPVRSTQGTG